MDTSNGYFEGCGREGPIRCIFLCEFHHTVGPKITGQVPENYISKEIFDTVSVYIIPKAELQRSTITVTLLGIKILGFPVPILDYKYKRNAFYFNLCFVCDSWARTVHYEPVVKKLTDYLVGLELEFNFLSLQDQSNENMRLVNLLSQALTDLNATRMCTLTEGTTTAHLKVVRIASDPPPVLDHLVPIFTDGCDMFAEDQWDLTTQQVLPYINGFNHVSKIAVEADVENSLVKSCIQNLIYYGVVTLIPIFQYSNVYALTPKFQRLIEDEQLRDECLDYVSKCPRQPPRFNDVFAFYAAMNRGTTIKDLCIRLNPHGQRINERRLVQFGVLRGLIHRIHRHIIYTGGKDGIQNNSLYKVMNGAHSADEICCSTGMSPQQLEDLVEKDTNLLLIWK